MTKKSQFQFSQEHLETIKEGVLLFNTEKFWECHEELEHHWLEARGDNIRYIYWAVIQAAACLYHVRQENLVGARGLLTKTLDKLEKCENLHVESELLDTALDWNKFKTIVRSVCAEPELKDFSNLYQFKFKTPENWSNP